MHSIHIFSCQRYKPHVCIATSLPSDLSTTLPTFLPASPRTALPSTPPAYPPLPPLGEGEGTLTFSMRGMNQVADAYEALSGNNKLYVSRSDGKARLCCLQYENQ